MIPTITLAILAYVVIERLVELVISRRNTDRLLANGGQEAGEGHYAVMVALHVSWLAAIITWVFLMKPLPQMELLWAYGALQVLRFWVMASLGRYWTTRIITVPNAPLVRKGPYRFLKHPNYVVVVLEVAVLPLMFGALYLAVIYTLLNALMLSVRIRTENATLSARA